MRAARLLLPAALVLGLAASACRPPAAGEPANRKAPPASGATRARHVEPLFVHVTAAAFSPDNKYVLTGFSAGNKLLTLWDATTGKEVRSFSGHSFSVTNVAFVAGGKRVLSAGFDGRLLLHDLPTGELLHAVQAYPTYFPDLAASPDGKLALTSGNDKGAGGVLKLWDADLKLLRTFGGIGGTGPAPHIPDDGSTARSRTLAERGENGPGFAVSPDGRWAVSSPPVRLWDLKAGRLVNALEEKLWGGRVAAFTPDSRLALVGRWKIVEKNQVAVQLGVWEVGRGTLPRLLEGLGGPAAVFTMSGKQVAGLVLTGDDSWRDDFHVEGNLKVNFWDVATGKKVRAVSFRAPKGNRQKLFFSLEGRLALVTAGGVYEGPWGKERPPESELTLVVWDLTTGRLVTRWIRPPADG